MKKDYTGLEIAIIGMAGRFPGANDVTSFWNNLKDGVESIRFFSDAELSEEGESDDVIHNPRYVKAFGLLDDKEYFDSAFFNYRPDEATIMDPQMRLFHECVWQAMEDAGCNPDDHRNKIGVFAGSATSINWSVYSKLINRQGLVDDFSASQLSNARFLASKVSYFLDLRGPSVFIDTTCSTSLVAIQQACKSLLMAECNIAIAGGITVSNKSKRGYLFQDGMIFSEDGHCRTFDAESTGTVEGEGGAVVVLKTLKNALKDRDNIWAIIKGCGINNDGNNKVGYTAPSVSGQAEAIMTAQKWAKVEPESISYIEAHGTGTKLGDPIEVEALNRVFGQSKEKYCALGSVKSNVGHLDIAAGATGLIKTVLALKNRQIPPSLHFKTPNPEINFSESPFYVNTKLKEWRNDKFPLRAGVSSFGIGGTNVHVILEEAPDLAEPSSSRTRQLLLFSAKTPTALARNIENFKRYATDCNEDLANIAYTLQVGRTHFPYRKMFVCQRLEDISKLTASYNEAKNTFPLVKDNPHVVFMFSGQGSQYLNMCHDLYKHEPYFKNELDKCFAIIKRQSSKDLKSVIFSSEGLSEIDNTEFTQPALFVIEYAVARLLMNWGVQPNSIIGHSIGEYVAACISGVFSLEDALSIVTIRGALMQRVDKGSMLAISIAAEKLKPVMETMDGISLAAINSSEMCVVAGMEASINNFKNTLEKGGQKSTIIRTSHAFHSEMMDGILGEFKEEMSKIKIHPSKIPFISNLTGDFITDSQIVNPQYWVDHLRHTVLFSKGVEKLLENDAAMFVEVGPGNSLSNFVRSNHLLKDTHKIINLIRHPRESTNDLHCILAGIGELWVNGAKPDWNTFYEKEVRRKLSLPVYSFDKIKYPVTVDAFKMISEMVSEKSMLNEHDLSEWFHIPSWELSPLLKGGRKEEKMLTILFADLQGVSDALKEKLELRGEKVIIIEKGDLFTKHNEFSFQINQNSEQDYKTLFANLESSTSIRILFAWGIGNDVCATLDTNQLKETVDTCFYSLLNIAKAVGSKFSKADVQIVALTNNVHQVLQTDCISPAKSLIIGALKVIPKEFSNIRCSNIDISLSEKGNMLTNLVLKEVDTEPSSDLIAFRCQSRFIKNIKRVRLEGNREDAPPFVSKGTYLITGGLGGMALFLTRKIAEGVKGINFILVGRKQLPPKIEWEAWLHKEGSNNELYPVIKEFLQLESIGANIHYSAVDITDKKTLDLFITDIEKHVGKIRGVLHAAGIPDYGGTIHKRKTEESEDVFAAKLYGTILLGELLLPKKLDFFIVCSSVASVYAPFGQVGYVAANIFLDAFATYNNVTNGTNVISIGWNAWKKVGMAAKAAIKNKEEISIDSISPEEGYEILLRSLKSGLPQLTISKIKLSALQDRASKELSVGESENEQTDALVLAHQNSSSITTALKELWQSFFGRAEVDVNASFFDSGGDSLKALTMIGRINKIFGAEISLAEFFDKPTINLLSEYITAAKLTQGEIVEHTPISKATHKIYYKLSSSQKRLYFLYQLDDASTAYNMPLVLRLEGKIELQKLRHALEKLIARHEILRTVFEIQNGEPSQRVLDEIRFDIECFYPEENGMQKCIANFIRPFDLKKEGLIRVGLIESQASIDLLMVDMHHIVADGVSHGILVKDFIALYNGEELPMLEFQYKDYAEWQQLVINQNSKAKEFWISEFSEESEVLQLTTDFNRPLIKSYNGNSLEFTVSKHDSSELKAIAERERVTMFMVVFSIFNVFLSKLTGQEDIVIGTPTAGRQHADLEKVIGMFVNTLPLRNYPIGNLSFQEFLSKVKIKTIKSFDNQEYPYEVLIDELKVARDTSRNPLFDVMFTYLNFENFELEIPGLRISSYDESRHAVSQFDLTLWADERNDQLHMRFEYSTDLFKRETIEKYVTYFNRIVKSVVVDSTQKIKEIQLLNEDERLALSSFNNTYVNFDNRRTINAFFEETVSRHSNAIAISFEDKALSYLQLNELSNRLARKIRKVGVDSCAIVGILLPRSIEMVVSILAVLKAGGSYVPIDPDYPINRIKYVIEDSELNLLLSIPSMSVIYNESVGNVEVLDVTPSELTGEDKENLALDFPTSNVAYLIYTSGSTGNPKGVMVEHHSVINFVQGIISRIEFGGGGTILCLTTISFDIFVVETILPLLNGMKIILASSSDQKDPEALVNLIAEQRIEYLQVTPSHLKLLLSSNNSRDAFETIKVIMVGGESFSYELLTELRSKFTGRIYNMYGPTETTVWSTVQDLTHADCITIGKPIANTTVRIVDKNNNLRPVGLAGELCIGGEGVARGYWKKSDLTNEKFIRNEEDNTRYYRTGDLGRWLPDGSIQFLGRIDNQVKIRGYRIELGEVESQMLRYDGIQESIVLYREKEGDKFLIGYYKSENSIEVKEIRNFLLSRLPEYMIPSYFVHVATWPLTPNGKINRKALPEPSVDFSNFVAPENELEQKVLTMWQEVLKRDDFGTTVDFFLIGGNSFKLIELFKLLDNQFPHLIKVRHLFEIRTVAGIADYIEKNTIGKQKVVKREKTVIEF